ncbi:MAG TPA: nitroreductase family deazaflavin-dependent oxidoreductase [Anaerolineae bacterium]|nr:nitroreductase family deazaflavin-dependent oxidoreductase [Anaerolineae bacterium]HRV94960.1 nitroreductase family deazaflavin-dependent oxidoreductase [Anaerolineae bacterium]
MRLFLRFPIWLYRLRLGWLLGDRFVMLQHTGRKSGLPRYTVVEVVRHDQTSDEVVIASGWGEKSDWFQNIQKTPAVTLSLGRRRWPAQANRLPVVEAAQELADYARRHPTAFANLSKMMIGRQLEATDADCRLLAESAPLVRLVPG